LYILAIDTTTTRGSLALARDGVLLEARAGEEHRTHGERLPGDIETLLGRHGLTTAAIDTFAVARGPGSFTGLRVGIATTQGLALAHDRRVVGLSVLDVLADIAAERAQTDDAPPDIIAPWVDAKRGEIFSALYVLRANAGTRLGDRDNRPGERWHANVGPVAIQPASLLNTWAAHLTDRQIWILGDGVPGCRPILEQHLGARARLLDDLPLTAGVMAVMASTKPWQTQVVPPHALQPLYVRRPDAELARERRQKT